MFFKKNNESNDTNPPIEKWFLQNGWCEAFYIFCINSKYLEFEIFSKEIQVSNYGVDFYLFGVCKSDILFPFKIQLRGHEDAFINDYQGSLNKFYKIENEDYVIKKGLHRDYIDKERQTIGECNFLRINANIDDFCGSKEIINKAKESYYQHPNLEGVFVDTLIGFEMILLLSENRIKYIFDNVTASLENKNCKQTFKIGLENCYEHKQDENRSLISPYSKIDIKLDNLINDDKNFTRQITSYEFISSTFI